MGAVQLVPAEFGGFVVETSLYGMYFVLHLVCIKILVFGSSILFITISAHWIINVVRAYNALVMNGGILNGSLMSYGKVADPLDVANAGALYSFEITVADLIMLYRLWMIWEHNRLACLLPAFSFLGFIVTGIGVTVSFTRVLPGQDIFLTECGRWIASALALTLLTNLYCSAMISYRIWNANTGLSVRHTQSTRLRYIAVIIIESTVIYTTFSLFTLVAYLTKSNVQFVSLNGTSPVIGLAFSLVIVRAGLGLGRDHISTIHVHFPSSSASLRMSQDSTVSPALNIMRETEAMRVINGFTATESEGKTQQRGQMDVREPENGDV